MASERITFVEIYIYQFTRVSHVLAQMKPE